MTAGIDGMAKGPVGTFGPGIDGLVLRSWVQLVPAPTACEAR